MMTSSERKAVADGYNYTGNFARSFKKDELKSPAAEYRLQGYKLRTVSCDGGYCLYIKDTPKTLAAKEVQAKEDETKRQELAAEMIQYLASLSSQIEKLTTRQLQGLRFEIGKSLGS